ncbi:MAG: hypothetical protein AB8F74_09155 [Saprospiraceae bacterium]
MKLTTLYCTVLALLFSCTINAQELPRFKINIKYSKLSATYNFIQKLSDYYPDNEYKKIFKASKYHNSKHLGLIAQLDTLDLYKSLPFEDYPYGQKLPLQTISLIEKSLINSDSVEDFASQAFGVVTNDRFFAFLKIISTFEPIFQELIYLPNKKEFDNKIDELSQFVASNNMSQFFETGLTFYSTDWDDSIPIDIAIIPSIENGGFTATAFMNNAVSEVPINFKHNDILFCVLMHEIFHLQFDGQPLHLKKDIRRWFSQHSSVNSQYAYLLLDEALATALGNGYVFEKFNNMLDPQDWYNVKYINLMAQKTYPLVKNYIKNKKSIDQNFVDQYVKIYDDNFSTWPEELDHILTYRYILSDNKKDFDYFRRTYRYASRFVRSLSINQDELERMKETPVTKVVIVSEENMFKLNLIKNTFHELEDWSFNAENDFTHTAFLDDKTTLIIVNVKNKNLEKIFEDEFTNKKMHKN